MKNQKIINVKPREYLQQGMRYCGGYTIKAVLSAYDLDDRRHPKYYLPSLMQIILPTIPKSIQKVLEEHGFKASIKRANNLSDNKKIEAIKKEINKNHPVILFIGNGYTSSGKYYSLGTNFLSHWISVWGYDNKRKVFFIYDSYIDPRYYDKIPIGNVKRSYKQVLRDWKGVFYFKSFVYIPVIKKKS